MWARCSGSSAALALLLTSAAEASSPSDSDVVWRDADWPGELGSLPFGNGLSTGQAWVEQTSGDLLMYLGRVDAFDVNAQPVHVGRVRLSFAPPLWQGDASDFEMRLDLARATVAISMSFALVDTSSCAMEGGGAAPEVGACSRWAGTMSSASSGGSDRSHSRVNHGGGASCQSGSPASSHARTSTRR